MVTSQTKQKCLVLIYCKLEEFRISVGAVFVVVCVVMTFYLLGINLFLARSQTLAQCTIILVGTGFCLSREFLLFCVLSISVDRSMWW